MTTDRPLAPHGYKSAVNRASLSLLATRRTRSSALDTPWSRRCVRGTVCWSAFPLSSRLSSTGSAAGPPALFASFAGTTRLSDSRRPIIEGLRPTAFPSRPTRAPTRHPVIQLGGAASAPTGDRRASRFSRMETPRMHRFPRPRRVRRPLALPRPSMLPSARLYGVGTPNR